LIPGERKMMVKETKELRKFRLNIGTHHEGKDSGSKLVNADGTRTDCPRSGFQVGDIIETHKDLEELNGYPGAKRFELIEETKKEE